MHQLYYRHTDPIGILIELINQQATIVLQANYKTWCKVDSLCINKIEQNLKY
ncbi:hypothetical protein [Gilliamella apicola]|uniref:hypothetical protein n=1 Tax=Gilliamella apicola TaxID=1196095 RepID=UPI0016424AA4|nr:hypothetical protein [Gilliamella apicola]